MTNFDLLTKCEEMVQETFQITGSSKMPKKYRFTLLNRLQDTALEIYANIVTANDLNLKIPQEAEERRRLQNSALTNIKLMEFYIKTALKIGLVTSEQVAGRFNAEGKETKRGWNTKVLDVKYMLLAWRKHDRQVMQRK
ncbi:four helix bundle protein [Caproicibacter fermentans]|uniref:Four helix bundle protein n=1 Tax=Caproicibacter fermentans TaxID=2576756 RepID=A0A7G8TDX7_9FIRM|nr:four helix bundle protein [Caproicibacter fermentans]QNK41818.1 four helix bundle protein [Caproicibacter fermentans]